MIKKKQLISAIWKYTIIGFMFEPIDSVIMWSA